jgi:hypothetical protein
MTSLKLTYTDVRPENKKAYIVATHRIQLKKMMKKHPNKVYRQTLEYYSGDNEVLSNKTFTYIDSYPTGDYEN